VQKTDHGTDCCARAASGHAATPPKSVMNSRRFPSNMVLHSSRSETNIKYN
jgi:hypothetical protein